MKKFLYTSIIIFFVGVSFHSAMAQLPSRPLTGCPEGQILNNERVCVSDQNYVLLAPIEGVMEEFDPKQEGAFGRYVNSIINIAIGLSAVMAVMMFVIGGIEYMTSELVHTKESARDRMTGAVLGLVIALGSWALLNTINPDLLGSEISIEEAVIQIALNDRVPQTPVNGRYSNGIAVGTPWTGTSLARCTTSTQTGCLPLYITTNNPECTSVGQQNCTSTIGLDPSRLRAVQWGCGCELVLSGGTEWWLHGGSGSTNHQLGGSTVDIRTNRDPDSPLNRYLRNGQPLEENRSYNSPVGPVIYEGDHWHIGT